MSEFSLQQFRDEFADLNIEIDDYTLELPPSTHRSIHPEYNAPWDDFFEEFEQLGEPPTADDVLDQLMRLLDEFDLNQYLPFVPYK